MPKELRSKIMPKVFAILEKQGFKHIQTSKSPYTTEFTETQVLLKHETKRDLYLVEFEYEHRNKHRFL